MTSPAILEISLLPDPLRAKLAEGYRELADANRMLFAETGTDMYRTLAEYAEDRADALAAGVSLLFDVEAVTCVS